MGDNKSLIAFGAAVAVLTLGALGILFVVLKPANVREAEAVGEASTQFPDSPSRAAASAPPAASLPLTGPAPEEAAGGPSSLELIQKDSSFSPRAGAQPGKDASQAAAEGDAAGVVAGLRGDEQQTRRSKRERTRGVMQSVVNAVHEIQPAWYKEFLADASLKKIADNYARSQDFSAFLASLASSKRFQAMLGAKAGTRGMQELVRALIDDDTSSRGIRSIVEEHADDPNLSYLLRRHGRRCGLPEELLSIASADAGSSSEEEAPAPKPVRKPMPRLKLKPKSFGGDSRPSSLAPGANNAQPNGMDIEELKRRYGGGQ
ncbi:MAG: hypothetical protein WCU88_05160 [Elusimicrobiota bacterium]|jgi:hypothetical protein